MFSFASKEMASLLPSDKHHPTTASLHQADGIHVTAHWSISFSVKQGAAFQRNVSSSLIERSKVLWDLNAYCIPIYIQDGSVGNTYCPILETLLMEKIIFSSPFESALEPCTLRGVIRKSPEYRKWSEIISRE